MLDRVAIILVSPQMGENIGAAARGMMNFGICDLRLVNPRDGWPNERAIDLSANAFDHVKTSVYESLSDASSDLNTLYATTARSRDMVKPVYDPDGAAQEGFERISQSKAKIGFVFGSERAGLDNDDISLCHGIINVPTYPDFSSLNLGQCVLLIAYALSRYMSYDKLQAPHKDADDLTSIDDLVYFIDRLDDALHEASFFKTEESRASIMRNIRNIYARNDLTTQELKTLHGVITALKN